MKNLVVLLCGLLLVLPIPAGADIIPWDYSYAEIAYQGSENLSLMVVPDGSGPRLTETMTFSGLTVDATITIHLIDGFGDPVAGYPAEDMWLESTDSGLVLCPAGSIADGPTDAAGISTWLEPLNAGGFSRGGCIVLVNGAALASTMPFALYFNSPDINGDLVVDLSDVILFTMDFYGVYDHRSDFHTDGHLNLSDLAVFAQTVGAHCP